jgi:hypothetical protein
VPLEPNRRERLGRHLLLWGASGTIVGSIVCLLGRDTAGGALVLASLGTLLFGLHSFGRSGADSAGKRSSP